MGLIPALAQLGQAFTLCPLELGKLPQGCFQLWQPKSATVYSSCSV